MNRIPSVAKLVIEALKDMEDTNGSSFGAIKEHIQQNYNPAPSVLARIPLALRKGIAFGAIKRKNGVYKLDSLMTAAIRQHRKGRRRSKSHDGHKKRRRRRRRHHSAA